MDARLKSFADRLDRLEDERQAIVSDSKDIYTEVKSAGYNPKALRKVLADRRRKTDAALQAEIELYRSWLGEPGSTYRSVADRLGVSKSKLQRLVPQNERGTAGQPAHDPDTGEIVENGDRKPQGDDTRTPEPSRSAEVVATPISESSGRPDDPPVVEAAGGAQPPRPLDTRTFDEIVGERPAFLNRVKAA